MLETFLLFFSILLIACIVSSKVSDRFGIPSLVVFLAVGMLAGSDGLLGLSFDNRQIAQDVGTIALIFILYAGGLDTNLKSIRPVMINGIILATLGVVLTAGAIAVLVKYLLGLDWLEALLFGSIISSTDAAAVFAILGAKEISLRNNIRPLLELESGSNDPMAIFLTLTMIQIISVATVPSVPDVALTLVKQFLLGGLMGYMFGVALPGLFNRLRLEYWGLYPVFSMAWVLLLYVLAGKIGGNGFLAVYIAGMFINKKEFAHKKNLIGFHDGIAWTMQIVIFLTLGLLVNPSQLPAVALAGVAIAFWIMFVARPMGVFLSLLFSRYSVKEKMFISWVGLRGVVPIVLATYPFGANLPRSELIFNTIFFVVFISIIIQGMTLEKAAQKCGVKEEVAAEEVEMSNLPIFYHTLRQYTIRFGSEIIGKNLAELELPSDFLVLLVKRKGEYVKPTGSSVFEEGDLLLIQCEDENKYNEIIKTFTA
ncbi:potassium/proton antiporter [Campylobacter rectus RM3267]|uniref:K+/H+ antiporter n=2 Tax=Campylobacter rectus TaxID=203 RepID=A0A6G5QLZ6_CAMRE|nr:potassium/proton antiporter [Campylobacter rectus]EEF12896.1 potassium/proton antiporter [Campylobacter rectus RM3267]QCD46671.1 K+/H+ antiporter [Campylobacter rectus]RRD55010.1 potassium/proton antiporter [Campylobacter rectus]UEB47376.1 potassium/proton antiporter [Campylobacter rectus]